MKINISALPDTLRAQTEIIAAELNWSLDANGYTITAEQGDGLSVVFNGKNVTITYSAINQFFRGLLLFKKSFNKKGFSLHEDCLYSELGIMVDCSRNAVRSVAHVKEIICRIALMGYNQLQLYTEDTYEVENEPYFGYMRGRYTALELKEIDEYAKSFGIELVPCIQTLAHLNQIFRWREYNAVHDADDILLIDEVRTYTLIENMFKTLSKAVSSRKIHIGMDEAHMIGRGRYADKNGIANKHEILLRHLNKVVEIAKKYGYEPMMWSDMFFRIAFDGNYFVTDGRTISQEVIDLVPDGLSLVYWDYYGTDKNRYDVMIDRHFDFNREVIFAGGAWMWTGHTPCNSASLKATELALDSCEEKGVKRIFTTLWGDDSAECADSAVLPVLCYTAERAYGNREWKNAFYALTDVAAYDFLYIDCANAVDEYPQPTTANPAKYMLFNDCIGGLYDGLVRSGCSAVYADYIKKLKAVEKNAGKFAYLFTTQRVLCEVLELKYELGLKTRNAYKTSDPKAIKELLKNNYYPLIKKLEAFYEATKVQWEKENKPYGFEIQDYRIGGLILRVKHCAERLEQFVAGKIKEIPELLEPMLDPVENNINPDKRLVRVSAMHTIISANRLTWYGW